MIETIDVKRIVPTEKQYAWTFGGVEPLARIQAGRRPRPLYGGLLRGPGGSAVQSLVRLFQVK